tara:strand:- start:3091 stop:3732 length:642 start_codon:yes stop_codon:yes gene_type:complete
MAYFLGSDVEVIITTELAGNSVKITETTNKYTIAAEGATSPTTSLGINSLNDTNQEFPGDALVDITGVDLGIGAMDEDIDYLGHNTPLKAEIRKNTTLTLTFKRKNVVFDVLYSGDEDGNTGRYGLKANGGGSNLRTGLEEPGTDIGYRLLVKLKASQEIFALRNCQMTANNITLTPDGTQEQSLEFTSMVTPLLVSAVTTTNLDTATGSGDI